MGIDKETDIVIIGAGPIGIAIAVRLFLSKRSFKILEKGTSVGAQSRLFQESLCHAPTQNQIRGKRILGWNKIL